MAGRRLRFECIFAVSLRGRNRGAYRLPELRALAPGANRAGIGSVPAGNVSLEPAYRADYYRTTGRELAAANDYI